MTFENYQQKITKLEQNGNLEALKKIEKESEDPVAEYAQQAINRLLEKQEQGTLSQHYAEDRIGAEKIVLLTKQIDEEIDQLSLDTQKKIEDILNQDDSEHSNLDTEKDTSENQDEANLENVRKMLSEFDLNKEKITKDINDKNPKYPRYQTKEEFLKNLEGKEGVSDDFFDRIFEQVDVLENTKTSELIKIKEEYFSSEEAKQIQEEKSGEIVQLENSINDKSSIIHQLLKTLEDNPEDKALQYYTWKYFHEPSEYFSNPEIKKQIIDIITHPKLRIKLMETEKNIINQQNNLMSQMVGKYSKRVAEDYLNGIQD